MSLATSFDVPLNEIKKPVQDLVNVVDGGGSVRFDSEYASLATAISDIGATVAILRVTASGWSDGNANNTIPSTLIVEFAGSGTLSLSSGKTTTILSDTSHWPKRQIFTGSGTVSFAGNAMIAAGYPEWWGNNTTPGTTVMTNPIKAAIAALQGKAKILFSGPGDYLVDDQLNITADNTWIEGTGFYMPTILFNPASFKACFAIANGASVVSWPSIRNLGIRSTNTVKKAAISLTDVTEATIDNVKINGFNSTGKDSIGLQLAGRQFIRSRSLTISADVPVSIEDDPNTVFDCDWIHLSDFYLIADVTQPCIRVADNINLSNVLIENMSLIQGKYGFYWDHPTAATPGLNFGLTFRNWRWEQNTDDTGYMVYMNVNGGVQDLRFDGLMGGGVHGKGLYFRNVDTATLKNINYQGALEALNADSTDTNFQFENCKWATGTFTLTGFKYYNSIIPSGQNFRTVPVNNNSNAALLPATGDGAMTRGVVLVIAGGGAAALFNVEGSNDTVAQLTTNANFSTTAGHAATTNIYWSAGNSRYEIENKQGLNFTYSVYAWLDTVN